MLTSTTSETSRKLFQVIERGSKLHPLVRNEIDVRIRLILQKLAMLSIEQQSLEVGSRIELCVLEIENCITLFQKKCRPIIEETCPFHEPILELCADLRNNYGDESWMNLREYYDPLRYVRELATITDFIEQMK